MNLKEMEIDFELNLIYYLNKKISPYDEIVYFGK